MTSLDDEKVNYYFEENGFKKCFMVPWGVCKKKKNQQLAEENYWDLFFDVQTIIL